MPACVEFLVQLQPTKNFSPQNFIKTTAETLKKHCNLIQNLPKLANSYHLTIANSIRLGATWHSNFPETAFDSLSLAPVHSPAFSPSVRIDGRLTLV